MRLNELFDSTLDVPTLTPVEIAKKHGTDIQQIKDQLKKGIKVEFEHTSDKNLSREIALDHLAELPDYYDRLADMEELQETWVAKALAKAQGRIIKDTSKTALKKLLDQGKSVHEIARLFGKRPRQMEEILKTAGLID